MQAFVYHGYRNCRPNAIYVLFIPNWRTFKPWVLLRWSYRKAKQQHQVSMFDAILIMHIKATRNIVLLGNKTFNSFRVFSSYINEDGTHWKEDRMFRKGIHDDLNTLCENKQLIDLPTGGSKIVSSPSLPPDYCSFQIEGDPCR